MKLFEVIVYVQDMEKMVRFYRDCLGFVATYPACADDYAAEHWVAFDAGGATLALHSGGTGSTGSPPRFGFAVEEITLVRNRLMSSEVPCSEVRSPAPGVLVVDCADPEGNGFFLEEHTH